MFEEWGAGLFHIFMILLILVVGAVICGIYALITGNDPLGSPPSEAEPTEAVAYVSERVDPSIVPWELVRKMYYAENKYWVDIDGVPVEIRRCEGAEANGQYYFLNPLPTS